MIGALRRFLADRRGVAAIEAALILPVVLVMIAGIIEYGRFLLANHMIRDIVDEAVRTAVLTDQSAAQAEAAVDGAVAEVPVLEVYAVTAAVTGTSFTVTVSGTFASSFGALLPDAVLEFNISSQYPL